MANINSDLDIHAKNFITSIFHLAMVLFAGRAALTIANLATGKRYSFRLQAPRERTSKGGWRMSTSGPWHIQVRDAFGWSYLGTATQEEGVVTLAPQYKGARPWDNRSGSYTPADEAYRVASYLLSLSTKGKSIPSNLRIWAAAHCCRCGQTLTSEYRHLGIGPVCSGLSVSQIMAARTDAERLELLHTASALGRGTIMTETMAHILRLMPEGPALDYHRIKAVMDTQGQREQIEALRALFYEHSPSEAALKLMIRHLPKGAVRDYAKAHKKQICSESVRKAA